MLENLKFNGVENILALRGDVLEGNHSIGVRGIHLYTMNNPYIAKRITNSIGSILNSINKKQVI